VAPAQQAAHSRLPISLKGLRTCVYLSRTPKAAVVTVKPSRSRGKVRTDVQPLRWLGVGRLGTHMDQCVHTWCEWCVDIV